MVKYTAPFLDGSGYGQAARNSLLALVHAGCRVKTDIVRFSNDVKTDGIGQRLAVELSENKEKHAVHIVELTPDHFPKVIEKDVYNIGFIFWEVVGFCNMWVWCCNQMDEIWTSSNEHANIMRSFGVRVPIKVFGVPIDIREYKKNESVSKIDGFKFYSVFQWTERKNPMALIGNYFREFEGNDDVSLILKTYRANYSHAEKGAIMDQVDLLKLRMGERHYPNLVLLLDEMTSDEVMGVHAAGDVFVSAHRGEGWGMPQMEAMSQGKPIISTNWGGIHGWLNDESAWLIPFKYSNVFGMDHIPWYDNKYLWADVNGEKLRSAMRSAYSDGYLCELKGSNAKKIVEEKLSYKFVGREMADRLSEVE